MMPIKNPVITNEREQGAAADSDRVPEPFTLVLFGASGDLTQRLVMPAIFRLARRGLLSPKSRVIGYARSKLTDNEFRERMREAVLRDAKAGDEKAWAAFAARLSYLSAAYDGDDLQGYAELTRRFEQGERETGTGSRRLFYLATPPELIAPIMNHLSDAGLAGQSYQPAAGGWARLIIEKPFGRDLASARALNADITRRFTENDIFRIDHFLGKEIVQNLFALRFANSIFEPVWNRNYIDHVQITAAETLGMEGRGSYFETAGIVRDMLQNHLLQLCALVAIEPPAEWNPRAVRDEKAKVLRAVRQTRPAEVERDTVRGQYAAGAIARKRVSAYREEEEVAADSQVETYAALKLYIDNSRWAGVPFYLRSGKRLAKHATEIVIEFKPAPHTPWSLSGKADGSVRPNLLIVNVSPDAGIVIRVEAKRPGQAMRLQSINLDYCQSDEPGATESPSAYERLLLDCLHGDPSFFARADEVEAAWAIVEPIIKCWEAEKAFAFPNYAAGSPGPVSADKLLARDGRRWFGSTDQTERNPGRKQANSSRAKRSER
ncbi:MAG: glucose-6-phosphate dehydrogenase [Thermoflexales bacterium]